MTWLAPGVNWPAAPVGRMIDSRVDADYISLMLGEDGRVVLRLSARGTATSTGWQQVEFSHRATWGHSGCLCWITCSCGWYSSAGNYSEAHHAYTTHLVRLVPGILPEAPR